MLGFGFVFAFAFVFDFVLGCFENRRVLNFRQWKMRKLWSGVWFR